MICLENYGELALLKSINFKYMLSENWFCSTKNMIFTHNELKKLFIIEIRFNRLFASSREDNKKRYTINLSELEIKNEETIIVFVKSIKLLSCVSQNSFHKRKWIHGCFIFGH